MRASNESHGRRTRRFFARYVVVMVLGAFAVVVSVSIRRLLTPLPYRQTVVVTGEPVYVLSIDAKRHRVTGLSLSSDTVIRGAHGVGKYSLGSLVSLDAIDKRAAGYYHRFGFVASPDNPLLLFLPATLTG